MIYLYSIENCSACEKLKAHYIKNNIKFEERSGDRMKNPEDEIDILALCEASNTNMTFPVVVEK